MMPYTRGELLTIKAQGCLSGTCAYLFSDLFASSGIQYIRIPKGFRAKVFEKTATTSPVSTSSDTVFLQYVHDSSSGVLAPWVILESVNVNGGYTTTHEKRKPLVLRGFTGMEAISVMTGVSGTTATYEIEISPDVV
jgi:hypothetical protein